METANFKILSKNSSDFIIPNENSENKSNILTFKLPRCPTIILQRFFFHVYVYSSLSYQRSHYTPLKTHFFSNILLEKTKIFRRRKRIAFSVSYDECLQIIYLSLCITKNTVTIFV